MTRASNDPERWAAIERLYHAALEREPDQRESFLFEACRDNEAVRQEVLSLLRYDAPEGRFLQGSPMEAAARMSASSTALSGWTLGAPVQCPSCSTEVPRESRFCLSCGEAISPSPQMPAAGPVRRLISSDSIPAGGFTPGAILGGRYRIIGLLGRGGMGEVYRADDLKLGQTVALKFLPAALASDPVRRERFFAEVRITRQLSHPNICRVYDIAEFEGRHFLSMEYIDGEDLASLIKRIGYLSNEKALELARQLVAGVAMAHDKGVLHRDLKPANIMIDGHGRVRITDFGLAVAAGDETGSAQVFGTPAYMAPEQFAGQSASVRSDIYALGLILYEIYTGKKAFTASTIAELRAQKEGPAPTAPSEIREGVDPLVERIIMRCLDRDPRSRPQSAVQLAASLPGGDPLAAAIAAGETPSPEMVAASGLKEGIRPAAAVALLAVVMAGAFAAIAMNKSAMLYPRAGLEKAPEVLVERSRNLIKKLGYAEAPADSAFGFGVNPEALRYIVNNDNSPNRWDKLEALNAVTFWYRQSLHPIERKTIFAPAPGMEIWFDDPPLIYPGDALVTLDGAGRLRGLTMVTRAAGAPRGPSDPDWSVLFAEAGLDPGTFKSVGPPGIPSFYADTRASWQGLMPNGPDVPVTIEAAAFEGKPVAFRIDSPWSADSTAPILQGNAVWVGALSVAVLFAVIGGGVFLARRNIRLGRGDRRGAMRLILFNGSLGAFGWILNEHHVAGFGELPLVLTFICGALFASGFMWTLYIGLEPFARRRWPHMLISWSRLLAGEWRDPLVGRDVLLGCAAGVTAACLFRLAVIAQSWFGGQPTGAPFWFVSTPFLGTRPFIGGLIGVLGAAIGFSLGYLLILFFFRALFRKDRLAFAATVLVMGTVNPLQPGESGMPWLDWVIALMFAALLYLVLFRAGLVATVVMNMVNTLFSSFPMTFDTSAWYSSIGFAALAVVMALSLYGFRTSLGSRPLFEPKLEL